MIEAREILGVNIESVRLEIDEIQSLNPLVVVEKKAKQAFEVFQNPVLVEDTSLFFECWNQLPGVYIDAFMKSVGISGLIKMMQNEKNRKARALTYISIFNGKECKTYEGEVKGEISESAVGEHGFGWDPIFIPTGLNKTFAQMLGDEKNQLSMRKIALEKFKKGLKSIG